MIPAFLVPILGDIAKSAAWSFVERYWKPMLIGAGVLTIGTILAVQAWRIDSYQRAAAVYEKSVSDAVAANKSQTDTIRHLNQIAEAERLAVKQLVAARELRVAKYDKLEQEFIDAKNDACAAGADWDRLNDRLRALDQGSDAH